MLLRLINPSPHSTPSQVPSRSGCKVGPTLASWKELEDIWQAPTAALSPDLRASLSHSDHSQCFLLTSVYQPFGCSLPCPGFPVCPRWQMWADYQTRSWVPQGSVHTWSHAHRQAPAKTCLLRDWKWAEEPCPPLLPSHCLISPVSATVSCLLPHVRSSCRLLRLLMHHEPIYMISLCKHETDYIIKLESIQTNSIWRSISRCI